jgi:hypothetical protein
MMIAPDELAALFLSQFQLLPPVKSRRFLIYRKIMPAG